MTNRAGQYFQCLLRRGAAETVAWIEARGAKVGVQVELLPAGEMWAVVEVNCGCVIDTREGDAPIKAWSCEHGQYWVSAGYYQQWVRDGRPQGIIR